MNKKVYEELKRKYSKVSSFTIWQKQTDQRIKSGVGDLSIFTDNIYEQLNTQYVFVALNASNVYEQNEIQPWGSFHSPSNRHNDYKLRYALKDTKYWGCYITDFFKNHNEVNSKAVVKKAKHDLEFVERNKNLLKEELNIISNKPILIAVGNDSFKFLNKYFSKEYIVKKIAHYSMRISKENYRIKILDQLSN